MKKNREIKYNSIGSSYIPIKISKFLESARKYNFLPSWLDSVDITTTQTDNYADSFEVTIIDQSAGEIFNVYEKMILNSKWDCRDNGDYQTLILGREYMFYTIDNRTVSVNEDDYENSFRTKITFDIVIKSPIEFFPYINSQMISSGITNVYDEGTILDTDIDGIKIDEKDHLEQMINRDKCRKVSENFFAVSGFNLIGHSISTNSEVPNTISEIIEEDKKNVISVLGDIDTSYVVEVSTTPEVPASSIANHEENEHRNDEFLANKLLDELRYCYQGSIIIKFNPNIEVGDTITLIDNVSSTYGIFEIDSYEHSLDQRGLLTSLIVKASWNLKDPILDYHSTEIGYKLINPIVNYFGINDYDGTQKKKINKLMSIYLKQLVQSPKYCVFYKKKKEGFFRHSTVKNFNINAPTALPVRFFPMFIKGKEQIPKSLEYAFVYGKENGIGSVMVPILARTKDLFNSFIDGFSSGAITLTLFVFDLISSLFLFNMNEIFKPLIGWNAYKAKKNAYDAVKDMSKESARDIVYNNPYEKKYKLMNNKLDYVFGFFNIRLQKEDDLYAMNKLAEHNKTNNTKLLSRKIETVSKLMKDVFDTLFLVELYDDFNIETLNKSQYNFEDFLFDCTVPYNHVLHSFDKINENIISGGKTVKEYGAVINRKDNQLPIIGKNFINLSNGRQAIEIRFNVSSLELLRYSVKSQYQKGNFSHYYKYLEELKVVFFHNLYGDSQFDNGKNSLAERQKNVDILLDRYKEYCDSKSVGVVIMGDFNLNVYNHDSKPYNSKGSAKNYVYRLPNDNFIAKISSATTLSSDGYLTGNQYDNVIVTKNINDIIFSKVFEYAEKDKLTISDHVPVYFGIKK